MLDATTYHGDVLQFANGQTMGGAYQPPVPPTKIATLDIAFTATDEATLTFTEASASGASTGRAKAGGKSSSKSLQPQFPKMGTYQPPAALSGYLSVNSITHDASTPGLIYDAQHTVRVDFGWKILSPVAQLLNGKFGAGYDVDYSNPPGATITVTFNATAVTSAGTCTQTGSETLPLGVTAYTLTVTTSRKYYLIVDVDFGALLPVEQHCEFYSGGSADNVIVLPLATAMLNYEGVVVSDTIAGGGTKTTSEGPLSITQHFEWSFIGK